MAEADIREGSFTIFGRLDQIAVSQLWPPAAVIQQRVAGFKAATTGKNPEFKVTTQETSRNVNNATPSRTAIIVAVHRAVHQIIDRPVVFVDPLAMRILSKAGAQALRHRLEREQERPSGPTRAFIAARSRFAEDILAKAVREGTRQFVLLGAGLDTFAYRNPYERLTVFEVDHPATQAFKRAELAATGIEAPRSLVFVPLDFSRQPLAAALAAAGFRHEEPAVFSWLGVTMYLDRAVVLDTLATIASHAARGTAIAFDYVVPPATIADAKLRARYELRLAQAPRSDERWRSRFEPWELGVALRKAGFARVEDWNPESLNERYFAGRTQVVPINHLIEAWV